MKALGVLGTGSGAGKTWMTAALCAWLRGQGVRVAPFKAQNMSNNAWVTPGGGEMARAHDTLMCPSGCSYQAGAAM